jgi:L-threonylcarbamoyladenylate synthase
MIGQDIQKAADLLKKGELVAIPTETVYGLAANALDTSAVAKIFEAKERPSFDPLIIHTNSLDKIRPLVKAIPEQIQKLIDSFSPGPLTVLLEKGPDIPDLVTSGLPTVAVRIPAHPVSKKLLESLDFPLAAPSANPFGYISPTRAKHVDDQLGKKVSYILDGGNCDYGLESTIVELTEEGNIRVLRKGGLPIESLEEVVGSVEVNNVSSSNPSAPGMLKSHYAPKTPIYVGDINKSVGKLKGKKVAFIGFNMLNFSLPVEDQFLLSMKFDLKEAASNLFAVMRQLDKSKKYEAIVADWFPDEGLGKAINDRLRRASSSF